MLVSSAPTAIVAGKAGERLLNSNITNNLSNPNRQLGSCDGKTETLIFVIFMEVPWFSPPTLIISANVRQKHDTLPLVLHKCVFFVVVFVSYIFKISKA